MFLYRIQPVRPEVLKGAPSEFEASKISEHFSYLKSLTENGIVLLAGRTTNTDYSSFGIVILRAASEDAARDLMNRDPAVKNGVFRSELFPYSIALFNDRARE